VLLSALGCNLAWGIIDGVFYLLACFSERGRGMLALRRVRKAAELSEAHRIMMLCRRYWPQFCLLRNLK
jgi:hypothetical protein